MHTSLALIVCIVLLPTDYYERSTLEVVVLAVALECIQASTKRAYELVVYKILCIVLSTLVGHTSMIKSIF